MITVSSVVRIITSSQGPPRMILLVWILKDWYIFCKIDLSNSTKTKKNKPNRCCRWILGGMKQNSPQEKLEPPMKSKDSSHQDTLPNEAICSSKFKMNKNWSHPVYEDFFPGRFWDFSGRKLGKGNLEGSSREPSEDLRISGQIIATKPLTGKTPKGRASMGNPPPKSPENHSGLGIIG